MQRVFILSAKRTPIGSFQGKLSSKSAVELGTIAATSAIDSAKISPNEIQDCYFGNVLTANNKQAPARQVVLKSKCPASTEATTINKVCASGLKSVTLGAQQIQLGIRQVVLVGGMESMSNVPFYIPRQLNYGNQNKIIDGVLEDGLTDAFDHHHMGICGENISKEMQISRKDQDDYAKQSYQKSISATKNHKFEAEIAPVEINSRKGTSKITEDEEISNFRPDKMDSLKSAFI
eukprot:NODE_459_length_7203_cov_0.898226.p5 type:complete len:234 gc:universal NODE_459_length_7203_cov_0.898226:4177-3476(-)